MSGVEDEHSVEQFSAEAADPAVHDCICPGRADRGLDNLYIFAGEDSVDHAGERGVRSRITNVNCATRPSRSMSRVRACWATQPAVGCAVTPRMWTLRVACSTTAKQYSLVSSTVSQWKKSQARIPVCLAAQELRPGGTRAPRGRIDSRTVEDRPDCAGTDVTAQGGEFSGDASVSPVRVLAGKAQHQPAQRR